MSDVSLGVRTATVSNCFSESRSTVNVPGVSVILFARMVCDTGLSSFVSISQIVGSISPVIILKNTSNVDVMMFHISIKK